MRVIVFCFALTALSTNANAGEPFTSSVRMAGVMGDGTVFVDFPNPVVETNCQHNQVRIAANSPAKQDVLALALAAYTAGFELQVKTDGCIGSVPAVITSSGYVHAIRK